jgi:hypothetical protein
MERATRMKMAQEQSLYKKENEEVIPLTEVNGVIEID